MIFRKDTIQPRIEKLKETAPFDVVLFYNENQKLVKKFLNKNTKKLVIEDWIRDEVPETWWYQNKEGVLRANIKGISDYYTNAQKLEWIKCALDVVYFTRKYIKIISIDDGIIPFDLYDYQEESLLLYQKNRFSLNLQCRQSGKTQTVASFICWFSIFHNAKTSAILANKTDQAQEILERIQLSYELLPTFIQPGVKVYNKRSMILGNTSKIFSASSASSAVRGKSISLLFIDEAAFIPNDMQFYESTYPTISSGKESKVIIATTPNGTRGMFYKLWTESKEGLNSYARKQVTWNMVPGRNKKWKEETISNSSIEQFRQEHECIFRGSSGSLISGVALEELISRTPIEAKDCLKIYELPEDLRQAYVILVDSAEGIGSDYHAITVIDVTELPYKVVAVYKNNRLSELLLPNLILNIALKYNNAAVLIEHNSTGAQVANNLLFDLEYENTLMTVTEKSRQVLTDYSAKGRVGVKTSKQVKAIGCSNLKKLVEENKLLINDSDIIEELGTFVAKGKSYEAESGCNDDLVMSLVLFGWLSTQDFFGELTDTDLRKRMFDERMEQYEEEVMPFGFIDNGITSDLGDSGVQFGLGDLRGGLDLNHCF